jgi:hypothetical protein
MAGGFTSTKYMVFGSAEHEPGSEEPELRNQGDGLQQYEKADGQAAVH